MRDTLEHMQRRARELAHSGQYVGWRSVAFELQFDPALKQVFWYHTPSGDQAFQWLHSPATRAEIDALCFEARHGHKSRGRLTTADG
jgi:hypothetical protein